jgi:hypothetical protein
MKMKWGGCNYWAGTVRLKAELVKKPTDLLEYVLLHEMLHLKSSQPIARASPICWTSIIRAGGRR